MARGIDNTNKTSQVKDELASLKIGVQSTPFPTENKEKKNHLLLYLLLRIILFIYLTHLTN